MEIIMITLTSALKAAYMDTKTTGTKEIYCKPNSNVGTMTHGHVSDDLTIYGNGAYCYQVENAI